MKKIIAFFVLLILFAGGSWYTYNYFYGGTTYYTKITTEGEKGVENDDNGNSFTTFTYKQAAYDKDGQEKAITMREFRDEPLRLDAYLKLVVNDRKGVMRWEEVQQAAVPDPALSQLDK